MIDKITKHMPANSKPVIFSARVRDAKIRVVIGIKAIDIDAVPEGTRLAPVTQNT